MGMHTISNQSATQHRMGATRVSGMGVSVLHGEQVPGWPCFRISCGQWHYSGTSFFDLRRSFSLSDNSQTPGSRAIKSTLNPRWHQSRFPSHLKHPNRKSNDQPASLRNHILLLKSPILEDAVSAVPGISQHSRFCSIHRSCGRVMPRSISPVIVTYRDVSPALPLCQLTQSFRGMRRSIMKVWLYLLYLSHRCQC